MPRCGATHCDRCIAIEMSRPTGRASDGNAHMCSCGPPSPCAGHSSREIRAVRTLPSPATSARTSSLRLSKRQSLPLIGLRRRLMICPICCARRCAAAPRTAHRRRGSSTPDSRSPTRRSTEMLEPADDLLHGGPPDDPTWTETWWYPLYAPDAKISAYLYAVVRPVAGVAAGGVIVWDDRTDTLFDALFADYRWAEPFEHTAGRYFRFRSGLSIEIVDPMRESRIRYDNPDNDTS